MHKSTSTGEIDPIYVEKIEEVPGLLGGLVQGDDLVLTRVQEVSASWLKCRKKANYSQSKETRYETQVAKYGTVGLLSGGLSSERDISL